MIRNVRFAAVYVVILAMALHALIPAGWMPNPSATGSAFTICTMDGLRTITPPGQKPDHAPAQSHESGVCPFAAAAHFSPPVTLAALLPRPVESERAVRPSFTASFVVAVRDWNRAARAPPRNA